MVSKKTASNDKDNGIDLNIKNLNKCRQIGNYIGSETIPDDGEGWITLREDIQKLLTIDQNWSFDSEEHLWWWGSPMVTEVGTELIEKDEKDGITRRIVSVLTHVCVIEETINIDDVYMFIYNWNGSKTGCTALLYFDSELQQYRIYLNFSLSYSTLNKYTVYAITTSMAMQAAFGMDLFRSLLKLCKINPILIPHPVLGFREDADEMALMFHPDNPNTPYFDMLDYFDENLMVLYAETMGEFEFLERGWSNSEAIFFQLCENPAFAVGMGVLSNAETPHGSGVLFGVTTPICLPILDNITNAKLINEMNLFIHYAPKFGKWIEQLGPVVYEEVEMVNGEPLEVSKNSKKENCVNLYSIHFFLKASAIRNNDFSVKERAVVLTNWALALLAPGIYLGEFFDKP